MDLAEFPLWKKANVTPVFKSDAKDVVENYRSISLLSIPSKCQEKIVHNAIYSHVAPYLSDWQHGFVRGRSCVTQLVLSHHHWSKALHDVKLVGVPELKQRESAYETSQLCLVPLEWTSRLMILT